MEQHKTKTKPLKGFELQFIQMDKNFARRMGVKWPEATGRPGNLHNKLENLFDQWELKGNTNGMIHRSSGEKLHVIKILLVLCPGATKPKELERNIQ